MKTWSKRWFVFDRNKRTLVYYADKSEVSAINVLSRDNSDSCRAHYHHVTHCSSALASSHALQSIKCLFSDQSQGRDLFPLNHGGVRGPPDLKVCVPAGHILHEDSGPQVLPHGALTRGHEDLGGRPVHGRRGLPGVPGLTFIIYIVRSNALMTFLCKTH